MPATKTPTLQLYGDGTSQAGRALAALNPDTAPVDERQPADWLAFLKSYAAFLRFYNLENTEQGRWSDFFGDLTASSGRAVDIATFLNDPDSYPGPEYDTWRRPHFALLLAFLGIQQSARDQINTFTRRHLDFYYRQVLALHPRPATQGQVHVLIEPAEGQAPFLLPAGTLLNAGKDAAGGGLQYQTNTDLVVTPAVVNQCRSVFLQRTVVGLDDVRRNPEVLVPFLNRTIAWLDETPLSEKTFQALLEVAVGDPNPGDPLPNYPYDPNASSAGATVANSVLFLSLDDLIDFVCNNQRLALSVPAFRTLMELRRSALLTNPDVTKSWATINGFLEKAGGAKRHDTSYKLTPSAPDDFITNLKTALNLDTQAYSTFYDTLPVDDIYGLYRRIDNDLPDHTLQLFVENSLYLSVTDFKAMMQQVEQLFQPWRQILDILRGAGRRKQAVDKSHVVNPPNLRTYDPNLWNTLLRTTIGDLQPILPTVAGRKLADLDAVDAELQNLERSFSMAAEDFATVRAATSRIPSKPDPNSNSDVKPWEWDAVYQILTDARRTKEIAKRRAALLTQKTVDAMWTLALGAGNPTDHLQPGEITQLNQIKAIPSPTDADLAKAAAILELAQERLQKWSPPPLQFESWDNLYAAVDATAVRAVSSAGSDPSAQHWRTFGDGYRPDGATTPASLGFMIASPLLALSEGLRTITLTLSFTKESYSPQIDAAIKAAISQQPLPFSFLLSTAKGFLEIAPPQAVINPANNPAGLPSYPNMLRFVLQLDEQTPPIVPLPSPATAPTATPILQVLLQDLPAPTGSSGPVKRYEIFRNLVLDHVHLHVDIAGVTGLLLQNDEAQLNPKQPFDLFGHTPVAGSRFSFAHPEICAKQLDKLDLEFAWLGLPQLNFGVWYQGYDTPPAISDNQSFTATWMLSDNRAVIRLKTLPLFADLTASPPPPSPPPPAPTASMSISLADIQAKYSGYSAAPGASMGPDPLSCDRYWVLELENPDFRQSIYPQVAAAQGVAKIHAPYTPQVKSLAIDYQASLEMLNPPANQLSALDQLYYVEPFGYRPINRQTVTSSGGAVSMVAGWLPKCDLEGQLFIGLATPAAPQNLPLLFQMAAGSADPDITPDPVQWDYLSGNQWLAFDGAHLLSDATGGLLNSGIIDFALPAAAPGTFLPSGYSWIRASMKRNSRGVCDVVDIRAQAVLASPDPATASIAAAGPTLPANSITGLVQSRQQVKAVEQPYSGFGGSVAEGDDRFALRVSERLRHKDRAVTYWDYERLVLEAFPDIYKAKCLPVNSVEDPSLAPFVWIILIPDIRGRRPFDPFGPKVARDTLNSIETFLAARCPAGARFRITNPRYWTLEIRVGVRFRPGCDTAFYVAQFNEDIRRFLSPWAYDDAAEIAFGDRVSANLIVNFLQHRQYVDYVANLTLFLGQEKGSSIPVTEADLANRLRSAPDVILVSAPDHTIDIIPDEEYVPQSFVGIGYMKIELDFRVA